jgi:hypothetical protein
MNNLEFKEFIRKAEEFAILEDPLKIYSANKKIGEGGQSTIFSVKKRDNPDAPMKALRVI